MAKREITDRYQGNQDEPSYDALIKRGFVLDNSGKIETMINTSWKQSSLKDIIYVKSGRGFYDVWRSNAQKMVRRGDEKGALKSLYEILDMGGVFASNILNRFFQVMVSEDIGWAEPSLPKYAASILNRYYQDKSLLNDSSFRQEIVKGVQILVKCRKSRYVDYLYCFASQGLPDGDLGLPISDLLLMTTKQESSIVNRVIASILISRSRQLSCLISSKECDPRLVKRRKPVFSLWQQLLDTSPNKKIKEQVSALLDIYLLSGGEGILNLIHALLLVTESKKLIWSKLPLPEKTPSWEIIKTWDIFPASCAYDKHTHIGRLLNRDVKWFYRYGIKITNAVSEYEEVETSLLRQLV